MDSINFVWSCSLQARAVSVCTCVWRRIEDEPEKIQRKKFNRRHCNTLLDFGVQGRANRMFVAEYVCTET